MKSLHFPLEGPGSVTGWETKIPQARQHSQKVNTIEYRQIRLKRIFELIDRLFKLFTFTFVNPKDLVLILLTFFVFQLYLLGLLISVLLIKECM